MKPLTTREYDSLQMRILTQLGLGEDQARTILAARWPQLPMTVVVECQGRGASVEISDVLEYLQFIGCRLADGPWFFNGDLVDKFLTWAVANDRVRPTEISIAADHDPGRLKAILEECTFQEN